MTQRSILLCTVGTSLLNPTNFAGKRTANNSTDWEAVAADLAAAPPTDRACGAEVNSVASLVANAYVSTDAGIYLFHSDTDAGRQIASVLADLFHARGHSPVKAIPITDLQDEDPKRFRTKGLRNLAKAICGTVRDHSAPTCTINATGGYKAQIAIAVLLGQALGIPVYYMHERFSEIIAFPPMPVALDFEVWMRASGMLFDLEHNTNPTPAALYTEEWDEKYESLFERVRIDGQDYLELSPTGQIFHETFRERFRTSRDQILPPPASAGQKRPPRLEQSGWPGQRPEVAAFLEKVTNEISQVTHCATFYFNPDLPERTRFRIGRDGIEGIYSTGGFTAKFRVETTAQTPGHQAAVVAILNEWSNT